MSAAVLFAEELMPQARHELQMWGHGLNPYSLYTSNSHQAIIEACLTKSCFTLVINSRGKRNTRFTGSFCPLKARIGKNR